MFETLLSERLERHQWWSDRAVALASALHLALIATLLSVYSFSLEEVKLPELPRPPQEFLSGLQMVLPGPPPRAPVPEIQRENKPPAPDELVQPVTVPDRTDIEERPVAPESSLETWTDDPGAGPIDGTPGGSGIGIGPGEGGTGDLGAAQRRYGASEGGGPVDAERDSNIVKPESIDRPDPVYPRVAQLARIEGVVMLMAVVGLDGRVESVTVKSGNPMLVEAARAAVLRWRYTPALRDGQPIRVFISVRVGFSLR